MQGAGDSYAVKAVPLKGGLDLTTPRMLVEPGRLVDCLNYECVDTDGYKKIDGFERYDGGPTPSATSGFLFYRATETVVLDTLALLESTYGIYTGALLGVEFQFGSHVGEILTATVTHVELETIASPPNGLPNTTYFKVFLDVDESATFASYVAEWQDGDYWDLGFPIVIYNHTVSPTGFTSVTYELEDNGIQRAAVLASSISNADDIRATVDALPQSQIAYGLQHYKDRLHVVADCRYMYWGFDGALYASHPALSAREFFIGNVFRVGGSGGFEGRILDWKWLRGSFDGLGTTDGTRAVAKVLVYPTAPNGTLTTNTTVNIDRANDSYTSASVTCWKYFSSIPSSGPTDDEDVWGGVLYKGIEEGNARTSNNDWTQIDMGYEVSFTGGNSTIEPREITLATTQAQLDDEILTQTGFPASAEASFNNVGFMLAYQNSAASFPGATTDGGGVLDGSSFAYTLQTANATGVYLVQNAAVWGNAQLENTFSNFGFSVPEDAIITGISGTARCFYNSGSAVSDVYFRTVQLTLPGSENKGASTGSTWNLSATTNATSANARTFTFGSSTDLWQIAGGITPAEVNSSSFGIKMVPSATNLTAVAYLFWDQLNIVVHYFRPVGKLYFYDGATELETKLVRIHLNKGSWANGDAAGTAHIYDIDANGTRNYIKNNESIRLISGGSTIATVTSIKPSFLPSFSELLASDRRFEIVKANYFLNTDWEAIYGVHGLGRAWSYDNKYFRKIYTDYNDSLDKPSHVAPYRNYLALGYPSGNVLLSAISGDLGPQPEEFRAVKGAREFSFVDRVNGLTELADTSFGVFCRGSVHRLVLNTSASDPASLFYQAVISPNSGCIEYTLASYGDSTLYCDQYGVRTIEQTDVYGDLIARPLSFPVSPWLRPRLSDKKYWIGSNTAKRALFAHTVRAKNQYRVWFDDGYVLCMNLNTRESEPQFTFLRYGFGFGGTFTALTPIAHTNDTDKNVTERIFVSHWNRRADSDNDKNDQTKLKYVFELEKGWSFDGEDFPTRLTVNLTLLESPYNFDMIRKAELHGLDYNNTTLFCGWGTKYSDELSYSGMDMGDTFTPAARNTAGIISDDYIPFSKMIQVATRGRPALMKLKNSTTATGTEATSVIEPPHILQAVLLQYIPLKNEG